MITSIVHEIPCKQFYCPPPPLPSKCDYKHWQWSWCCCRSFSFSVFSNYFRSKLESSQIFIENLKKRKSLLVSGLCLHNPPHPPPQLDMQFNRSWSTKFYHLKLHDLQHLKPSVILFRLKLDPPLLRVWKNIFLFSTSTKKSKTICCLWRNQFLSLLQTPVTCI